MKTAAAAHLALLEGITVPAFLCRPDARVVAANGPAGALLAPWVHAPFDGPAGELVGCLNAGDAGCGKGPRCATCPVRAAVAQAAAGTAVRRVPVAMELVRRGATSRVELRISATPAVADGERLAVLTLEPAEWVR